MLFMYSLVITLPGKNIIVDSDSSKIHVRPSRRAEEHWSGLGRAREGRVQPLCGIVPQPAASSVACQAPALSADLGLEPWGCLGEV